VHLQKIDPIQEQLRRLDEQLIALPPLIEAILLSCPAVPAAIGFIFGISIQQIFKLAWYWPAAIAVFALIAGLFFYHIQQVHRRAAWVTFSLVLMFCSLGMLRLEYFYSPYPNDARLLLHSESYPATFRGTIISDIFKENRKSWVFGEYQFTEPSRSFYLELQAYRTHAGNWAKARGGVRVQIAQPAAHIRPMDEVEFYCVLSGFEPPANPGQFDFQSYMHNRGVYLGAMVETADGVVVLNRPVGWSFRRIALRLRQFAWDALLAEMPDQTDQRSAMATALLLGFQQNIDSATNEAFIKTGLSHVISLSGMHLAIIAGLVWWIAKFAGLSKRWRAVIIFMVITLYAVIIPPRAPTLRSVIICWVFCAAMLFRRKPHPINSLAVAAIGLLLFRPTDLFYPDWQLSYGTIFGILLFYQPVLRWMRRYTLEKMTSLLLAERWLPWIVYFAVQLIVEVFAAGFAAWAGGAGILLWHFGSIVPLCPLWTALVSPIVPIILYLGFLKILLAGLFPTIAATFGWIVAQCSAVFIWAVQLFAQWDITSLRFGPTPGWISFAYYAMLGLWMIKRHLPRWIRFSPIAIGVLLIFGFYSNHAVRQEQLTLTCLAVGHGQAVVLHTADNKTFLFDGGSITNKDPGMRTIVPYLKYSGVSTLDAAFISHGDLDHFNALPEIAKGGWLKTVYANAGFIDRVKRGEAPALLSNTLEKYDVPLKSSAEFCFSPKSVVIRPLWPIKKEATQTMSENDNSEVFLITYADKTILLCGDIEIYAQEKILDLYPKLKANILILPHHGSTTNLSEAFVRKISDGVIIASCAKSRMTNAYKVDQSQQVFYTGRDGAIEVKIKADGTISTVGFVRSD
jgi:competence protein ComEC